MIVIGADTHKSTHTCGAVEAATGQLQSELTAPARKAGFAQFVAWARELDPQRIWAIEDCRHVSGSFERYLVAHGERVVRVAPRLMGQSRKGSRERGKSDSIDALAVARAALKEGPETLPAAHLDSGALEIKLLLDHHDDLVSSRSADQRRLRWHLHDLWPELEIPAAALDRIKWLDRIAGRLRRAQRCTRMRVSLELVAQIRARTKRIRGLERELEALVRSSCPQLLEITGCGALTAAKLIAETAGIERFSSDAKLARIAGVAPIPVSSGRRDRHRLDKGGNRQLNCALHRLAVNQGRLEPRAQAYLARKRAEGKSKMESLRCLKRQLARLVWRTMRTAHQHRITSISPNLGQTGMPAQALVLT
jgi:transposase